MRLPVAAVLALSLVCAHAPLAGAQPASPEAASPEAASPEAASAESTARAAEVKKRGDDAIDTGRPADALAAYVEAYGLTKDPALLYNKGRALQGLGEYPQALEELEAFEKAAPPELRARVPGLAKQLSDLRNRVTTVSIACDTMGARVRFRDRSLGKCPLPEKLRIASGRGTLDVLADGYFPYVREVDLAPGGAASLARIHGDHQVPHARCAHDARRGRALRARGASRGAPAIAARRSRPRCRRDDGRASVHRHGVPRGSRPRFRAQDAQRDPDGRGRRLDPRRSSCSPRRPSIIASMSGRWASCFIACWLARCHSWARRRRRSPRSSHVRCRRIPRVASGTSSSSVAPWSRSAHGGWRSPRRWRASRPEPATTPFARGAGSANRTVPMATEAPGAGALVASLTVLALVLVVAGATLAFVIQRARAAHVRSTSEAALTSSSTSAAASAAPTVDERPPPASEASASSASAPATIVGAADAAATSTPVSSAGRHGRPRASTPAGSNPHPPPGPPTTLPSSDPLHR